jgi:hypothetical protein
VNAAHWKTGLHFLKCFVWSGSASTKNQIPSYVLDSWILIFDSGILQTFKTERLGKGLVSLKYDINESKCPQETIGVPVFQ